MSYDATIQPLLLFHTYTILSILILPQITFAEQNPFLPENHIPFYNAQSKKEATSKHERLCWGHELDCVMDNSFSNNFTKCEENLPDTKKSRNIFFNESDFGYIKQRLENMLTICEERPEDRIKSSLQCTNQLQFCSGKNIRIDFRGIANSQSDGSLRYNMDVLKPGEITAQCRLNKVCYNNKYISVRNII